MARVEPNYHDSDYFHDDDEVCCDLCGAIVSHKGAHNRWHAGITKLFEERDFWDHFQDEAFPDNPYMLGRVRAEIERMRDG